MTSHAEHARQFLSEFDAGLSVTFDAATSTVLVSYGAWVIDDELTIGDYKDLFGVEAVRSLLHGLDRRKVTK